MPSRANTALLSVGDLRRLRRLFYSLSLCTCVFALVYLPACATIVSGTTQHLRFTSQPPGATVRAEPGAYEMRTPGELTLPRGHGPYRVTFSLDGYEPYTVRINPQMNGWIWGNVIVGGLVGLVIDFATGASETLSPEAVHANLIRSGIAIDNSQTNDVVYVFGRDRSFLAKIVLAH